MLVSIRRIPFQGWGKCLYFLYVVAAILIKLLLHWFICIYSGWLEFPLCKCIPCMKYFVWQLLFQFKSLFHFDTHPQALFVFFFFLTLLICSLFFKQLELEWCIWVTQVFFWSGQLIYNLIPLKTWKIYWSSAYEYIWLICLWKKKTIKKVSIEPKIWKFFFLRQKRKKKSWFYLFSKEQEDSLLSKSVSNKYFETENSLLQWNLVLEKWKQFSISAARN